MRVRRSADRQTATNAKKWRDETLAGNRMFMDKAALPDNAARLTPDRTPAALRSRRPDCRRS